MLRQQAEVDGQQHYLSQADFVTPRGSRDHLGMFAVACFGAEAAAKRHEDANDDYSKIMVQALADRLVEAFAEKLHRDMRVAHWGYAASEALSQRSAESVDSVHFSDRILEEFQGLARM